MRSATVQFKHWTPAEAREFLRTCPATADTYGDRISAMRALEPKTSPREILENERYLASLGYLGPWREYIDNRASHRVRSSMQSRSRAARTKD